MFFPMRTGLSNRFQREFNERVVTFLPCQPRTSKTIMTLFHLAQHYKGKIARYAVENEAAAQQNWGVTPEAYMQTLQTAYKAIHAADPNAIVENSELSNGVLGIQTAYNMYEQGQQ